MIFLSTTTDELTNRTLHSVSKVYFGNCVTVRVPLKRYTLSMEESDVRSKGLKTPKEVTLVHSVER